MMKRIAVLAAVLCVACSKPLAKDATRKADSAFEATQQAKAYPAVVPPKPGDQWDYSCMDDEMSKGRNCQADVYSTNTVELGFPYNGPQRAHLTVRSHARYGRSIIFRIERGQLLCSSYDGCSVQVRWDDDEGSRYKASESSDHDSKVLFISAYDTFVAHLKKGKRLRIAANLYQEGAPVWEFDVSMFDRAKYKPTLTK